MMTSPQVGLGRWCSAMALALLLLVAAGNTTHAQTNDFQTWSSAGIKTDISKSFTVGFQTQLRLTDYSTRVGSILLEPEVGFRVNKYLKLGLGYRFTIRPGSDHINSTAHRLNLDVEGKKKFGNLGLSLRLRIQQGFQDPYVNENRAPYSAPTYNRNKLSVEYKVSKTLDALCRRRALFPPHRPTPSWPRPLSRYGRFCLQSQKPQRSRCLLSRAARSEHRQPPNSLHPRPWLHLRPQTAQSKKEEKG
jgi:hypothetical protein